MRAVIYVEGGGEDSSLDSACREGFSKLLAKCGFEGRMPRVRPFGSRQDTYDAFATAHRQGKAEYVALLLDSEDPVKDIERPWEHLANRKDDKMPKPEGATDEQALLMATCMETWIVADREALGRIYKGDCLQKTALPALTDLEGRDRHKVQDALVHATRRCKNGYEKGRRSFRTLEEIDPAQLRKSLPSFVRAERILNDKL